MSARVLTLAAFAVTLCAAASLLGVSNNLGISAIPTEKLKDAPKKNGLVIAAVTAGSPAAELDFKAGDIIISLNGKKASVAALAAIDRQPADNFSVSAELWSDGSTRTVSYSVADGAVSVSSASNSHKVNKSEKKVETKARSEKRPPGMKREQEAATPALQDEADRPWLGVHIRNDDGGVRVHAVIPGSPAEKAGLEADDLIMSIDGEPVNNVPDVLSAVAESAKGKTITVTVDRDGETQELVAKLGKAPAAFNMLPLPDAREWLRSLPHPPPLEHLKPPAANADLDAIWEELGRLRGEMERLRRDLHRPKRRK
jgi:C-terminal processing protease CtpA/Prc